MEHHKKLCFGEDSHFPPEIVERIYQFLLKSDVLSGMLVSKALNSTIRSYKFSSTIQNQSSQVLLFDENQFYILKLDPPPTAHIIYPDLITPPPLIQKYLADHEIENNLEFHGSCSGLICLTIDTSGFIVWNPTLGKCVELLLLEGSVIDHIIGHSCIWNPNTGCRIPNGMDYNVLNSDPSIISVPPAASVSVLVFGIGDAGGGYLEIACIGTRGTLPAVGVPISINLLSLQTGQWTSIQSSSVFHGNNPCYVGVATDILLWAYPFLNLEQLSGYNFRTRTIIDIVTPPLWAPLQGPVPPLPRKQFNVRLFTAAGPFCALGENLEGENYIRRLVGDDWVTAATEFELQESVGMAEGLLGSSLDFRKFIVLSTGDNLLLLHLNGEVELTIINGEVEFPITLIHIRDEDDVERDSPSTTTN